MKVNEEGLRGRGYLCCGTWMGHGQDGSRLAIGILLILIGLVWFGARMEWIELTWIHAIPFLPVMITICGIWMVFRGLKKRKVLHADHQKEG